ncbi:alpha/beta fold hydrolase [Kitasatospora sp. NBC_01300]|uniref:alpha/beta hydrolase n=1 Tax=Kitasatospora sp. NBC_01300 TaxID=2903574 RepID=UPI002F91A6A8|nr:lysophospholipase [Kitasatospora sp. NBC_01300]
MADRATEFTSLDGTLLSGTIASTDHPQGLAVLVHGAGVTREEGGFFTRLASALAASRIANLRFDLRGHGASGGSEHEITIAGVANDIRAATDHLRAEPSSADGPVHLIAASFSGGAAALVAAAYPVVLDKLVLLNPRLDYRARYITSRPYNRDDCLSEEAARDLDRQGFTERSPFALGRALLNEVHYLDPSALLPRITADTLVVHGTKDTFVPVDDSRRLTFEFGGEAELVELEGAQHGFAVHDDPQYLDPQTQAWQAEVITRITSFLTVR